MEEGTEEIRVRCGGTQLQSQHSGDEAGGLLVRGLLSGIQSSKPVRASQVVGGGGGGGWAAADTKPRPLLEMGAGPGHTHSHPEALLGCRSQLEGVSQSWCAGPRPPEGFRCSLLVPQGTQAHLLGAA